MEWRQILLAGSSRSGLYQVNAYTWRRAAVTCVVQCKRQVCREFNAQEAFRGGQFYPRIKAGQLIGAAATVRGLAGTTPRETSLRTRSSEKTAAPSELRC